MWFYIRSILGSLFNKFIKLAFIGATFAIVIQLFVSWGFSHQTNKQPQDILKTSRTRLYQVFQQPEYQTKQGKQFAALQKRTYCSLFGALCTNNPDDQDKDFPKSLFGFVSSTLTTTMVHPPASGIAYIQDSINKAGFTPKSAYAAQGIGFASLRPFQDVWTAFRNAMYLVLVLIIIAIGFMIMFQYKIDSHTVISIENALPRIVIAILVITFSYAIAGLLIDLTYLIILLVFQIFESTGLKGYDSQSLQTHYLTSNILSMGSFQDGAWYAGRNAAGIYAHTLIEIFKLIPFQIQALLSLILSILSFYLGARMAGNGVSIFTSLFGHFEVSSIVVSAKAGDILGVLTALFVGFALGNVLVFGGLLVILVIGLLFLYARIVFLLIGAYVKIIIQVIFAPIFLIGEAIPGQNSFANWLKAVFGNLMTFPIVITLLLVVQVVQTYGFGEGVKGSFSLPLLYGFDTSSLAFIISGAMLFAVPDLTREAVKKIAGESSIKAGPGLLFAGVAALGATAMGSLGQLETFRKVTGGATGPMPGVGGLTNTFKSWFGAPKHGPTPPPGSTTSGGKTHVPGH